MANKILLAGASGTIGSALASFLQASGYEVVALQRKSRDKPYFWDPEQGILQGSLEGFYAVINLAGHSVASGRWSKKTKRKIWSSRIETTKLLVESLKKLKHPPKVFLSASAIGLYGHSQDQNIAEDHPAGSGFLAEVCTAWEHEAMQATKFGLRVVLLRFGIVLTPQGGALKKMLPLFKLGLGGNLGSGNQWMSWIGLEDVLGIILMTLRQEKISGPLNVVSPTPITNKEFTHILAKVLKRPAVFHVPAPILRLLLGEMAEETLLASSHISPEKLLQTHYPFRHTDLEQLLRSLLKT